MVSFSAICDSVILGLHTRMRMAMTHYITVTSVKGGEAGVAIPTIPIGIKQLTFTVYLLI